MITDNVTNIGEAEYDGDKWSFKMNLDASDLSPSTKVKMDLLYGNRDSTGACILNNERTFFSCVYDEEEQSNEDKFRITYIKKKVL